MVREVSDKDSFYLFVEGIEVARVLSLDNLGLFHVEVKDVDYHIYEERKFTIGDETFGVE